MKVKTCRTIDASGLDFAQVGELLRGTAEDVELRGCLGQRFIAAGMRERYVAVHGIPGNALGAYLDGGTVEVFGNAQDAVGDTMNTGTIIVHGNIGDTAGYAMRGGAIYVQGNAGYRAGVHMKEYQDKLPVLVIGGHCGSFLGEYQAGGVILVLGLDGRGPIVSNFPCTGMHGGKLFLRSECREIRFPSQVTARPAEGADLEEIRPFLDAFGRHFDLDPKVLLDHPYTVVTPDSKNPYRQMYVAN